MKVFLLWDLDCFWVMKVVVRMGRWSEASFCRVVQLVVFIRWVGMMVRSGEVGCCRCR